VACVLREVRWRQSGSTVFTFTPVGAEASIDQLATVTAWQNKGEVLDISDLIETHASMSLDDPALAHVAPELCLRDRRSAAATVGAARPRLSGWSLHG
jgi:hypothetical protein